MRCHFDGGFTNFVRGFGDRVPSLFENGDGRMGQFLSALQRQGKPGKSAAENGEV